MNYAGHAFLVQKFRADAEVSGVRQAAKRWRKQGAPLSVILAVMRDALWGRRVARGEDGAWVAR
jgi:hypothetical protein